MALHVNVNDKMLVKLHVICKKQDRQSVMWSLVAKTTGSVFYQSQKETD